MKNKQTLYIDMDGTIAEWKGFEFSIDELYEKGYFYNLKPTEFINAVKALTKNYDVYILSSYLADSKYALNEKQCWCDKYIPEINVFHRIFVPCGESKAKGVEAFMQREITSDDILIDDYTKNLTDWTSNGGTGIKIMNGINGTKGTWQGKKIISSDCNALNLTA